MKTTKRILSLLLCAVLSVGAMSGVTTQKIHGRMDGFTNDADISQSKYPANINKYHQIFQMNLAGPGLTAWDYATGKDVNVAVLDNDFNVNDSELKANIKGCYNAITKKEGSAEITYNSEHGTSVATILGAAGNNGLKSAGVAYNCNLYLIQVDVNGTWQSYEDTIIEAIRYASEKNCRVINMSHGGDVYQENLENAINEVYNREQNSILVVASAGNTYKEEYHYPASYDNVLSVSSLKYADGTYSVQPNCTYNDKMDIATPGGSTSSAAPYAAGVAALLFQADPSLTARECAEIITSTVMDAGSKGYDKYYGHGIIQPLTAVQKAVYKTDTKSRQITGTASSYRKTLGDKPFSLDAKTIGSGILQYSSNNSNVASVNQSGVVTLKNKGTAIITISVPASGIFQSASKKVTVTVTTGSAQNGASSKITKPKRPVIRTIKKRGKTKIKITWKKVKRASGYQILISSNRKFKKPRKITVKKKSATSKVVNGFKKKKKYFVKMRAYTVRNKQKVYGKYSKIKRIKL